MAENAKVKVNIVHENSLDNSADSEYMGMVEEESYGSPEEGTQLVSQSFLENDEENTSTYSIYARQPSTVTYKLVHMTGEETSNNMTSNSSIVSNGGEYYVIGDPLEVFGNATPQKRPIRRNPLETKTVTTKKRDDKRRATHNEVERRRRDKINTWITRLAALVPNSGFPDSSSKGGILAKACDHITELTEKQKRLEKLELDNDRLLMEITRLNQELTEMRKDNCMHSQIIDSHKVPNYRLKTEP